MYALGVPQPIDQANRNASSDPRIHHLNSYRVRRKIGIERSRCMALHCIVSQAISKPKCITLLAQGKRKIVLVPRDVEGNVEVPQIAIDSFALDVVSP